MRDKGNGVYCPCLCTSDKLVWVGALLEVGGGEKHNLFFSPRPLETL